MQESEEETDKKTSAPISLAATYAADIQLADRYGVSRATIWRWAQHGKFPKPIRLSPGCTRWHLSDIKSWEDAQEKTA